MIVAALPLGGTAIELALGDCTMLSDVTTACFATSYAIVLLLEISRLWFRSGIRGAIMIAFATIGLVLQCAFLYYRAMKAVDSPLSSEQDWYLLAAWVLVVAYLYLVYYHPKVPFGLFLMPLALGLIAAATWFADPKPFAREPALKIWGVIHGVSILLGAVSVLIGFVAGLMYLWQARRLKQKLPPTRGLRLPSLEWLQRTNSRAIVISVLTLGVGVASGVILKFISVRSGAVALRWYDPIVLSTLLWLGWLLITVVAGKLYQPTQQGRKVAYLTVVSFVFLLIVLGLGLFAETRHWGGEKAEDSGQWTVDSGLAEADALLQESQRRGHPPPAFQVDPGVQFSERWVAAERDRFLGGPGAGAPSLVDGVHPLPRVHCPLSSAHCPLSSVHSAPATGGAA